LNALKLPTNVLTGLFATCVILLGLDKHDILLLSTFGDLAKPITILLLVLTGTLSLTSIITFFIKVCSASKKQTLMQLRHEIRKAEQKSKTEEIHKIVIARIDHLSSKELRYLANCLIEGSQTFNTYVHSPAATTLASKGLIYTPGGSHHQDHYPFIINDFVWKNLLENKDKIIQRNNDHLESEEKLKSNRRRKLY